MERRIGQELHSLNNMIMRLVDLDKLQNSSDTLTKTNGWIIGYLSENQDRDVFQRDLERDFSITRSTASKVVDLMVAKELIVREAVSYDARLKKLVLTDKAKALSCRMKADRDRMEAMLCRGISDEELNELFRLFDKIKQNLKDSYEEVKVQK